MSGTAPVASSSAETPRPQAGPLPAKRGEIGFNEEIHRQAAAAASSESVAALPERHPADRDAPPPAGPAPSVSGSTTPSAAATTVVGSEASNSTTSLAKAKKKCFFKNSDVPKYGGILLTTILAFLVQLLFFSGTIAGWAVSIQIMSKNSRNSDEQGPTGFGSASIFVHVVFAVALLGQMLFLERRIFRIRAERYAHVHPGEMLPSSYTRRMANPDIAFSPWNRPPLPTYAAALAQSGAGTGDVEDHIIAQPPPPAYGNTRGSTMILAGFLRDSLRAQRPVSEQSQMVQTPKSSERPLSYQNQEEQWQEIQDADRARRLEETLARLERPASRNPNP